MEVLLWQNIDELGKRGDVVTVAAGYARNYLFPRQLATPPDTRYRNQLENERRRLERQQEVEDAKTRATFDKLVELASVTVEAKANAEGHLFGSVAISQILGALEGEGLKLESKNIKLAEPIKELGIYTVPVRLAEDQQMELKVWVVSDKDEDHGEMPSEEEATEEVADDAPAEEATEEAAAE
jgi:large subunit ribosomal protein L9